MVKLTFMGGVFSWLGRNGSGLAQLSAQSSVTVARVARHSTAMVARTGQGTASHGERQAVMSFVRAISWELDFILIVLKTTLYRAT